MEGLVIAIVLIVFFLLFIFGMNSQAQVKEKNYHKLEMLNDTFEKRGINRSAEITYIDTMNKNNYNVIVDDINKKLIIYNGIDGKHVFVNYEDILGMEVQEDGVKTNGVGRAVVGGVLAGGAGAVVGAVTGKKTVKNIRILIYLKDVLNPQVSIVLSHSSNIKVDSMVYRNIMTFINQLQATIKAIIYDGQNIDRQAIEKDSREESIITVPIMYEIEIKKKKHGNLSFAGKVLNDFKVNDRVELIDGAFTPILCGIISEYNDLAFLEKITEGRMASLVIRDTSDIELSKVKYIVGEGVPVDREFIYKVMNQLQESYDL